MPSRIFISYARADGAFALRLAGSLRQSGFDVWIDQIDIPTGSRWDREIETALGQCPAFLIVLSPASVASDNVLDEVGFALDHGKDIVPVLYQPCSVPLRLRRFQHVDFTGDEAAALAVFAAKLQRLKGGGDAAGAIVPAAQPKAPPPSNEARYRTEGRIKIDAKIVHGAPGGWFLPGNGKTEWFKDHEHGPEMVVVPAGSFMMGSPVDEPEREHWQKGTESPQQKVTLAKSSAVGRSAVTRGQFAAFVNATGHKTEGGAFVWKGDKFELDPKRSWRDPGFPQDDTHPVVCVNWDDAKAYVAWLSQTTGRAYRLLSEAEREYAARAGTTTPFWWGRSITTGQANYHGNFVYAGGGSKGDYRKGTVPVVSFDPNPWGLYQVHGNVWEWCEDIWHDDYNGAPADGSSWLQGGEAGRRVVRGGSWDNSPQNLRSAYRYRGTSGYRSGYLGFRVGRTLSP